MIFAHILCVIRCVRTADDGLTACRVFDRISCCRIADWQMYGIIQFNRIAFRFIIHSYRSWVEAVGNHCGTATSLIIKTQKMIIEFRMGKKLWKRPYDALEAGRKRARERKNAMDSRICVAIFSFEWLMKWPFSSVACDGTQLRLTFKWDEDRRGNFN